MPYREREPSDPRALASLPIGAAMTFGVLVLDDALRKPGWVLGAVATTLVPIVIIVSALTFFGALGRAVVSQRIVDAGGQAAFSTGTALLGTAFVLLLPVPLGCFTLPLAAICVVSAAFAIRKPMPAKLREPSTERSEANASLTAPVSGAVQKSYS